jgi:hypothetical protein
MNVLSRNAGAALCAVFLPLLLLTACSQAARPAPPPVVGLGYCGLKPQVKPADIMVTCDVDAITATKLTWSAWGKTKATAKGQALVDLCVYAYMDCAVGDYTSVPIKVFVTKIKKCAKHAEAYSTLRYVFPRGSPWGRNLDSSQTGGLIPAQQLPPANQTVRLNC